jgi:hypothetical protein
MDGSTQLAAARKLADLFHIEETRTAPRMEKPSKETTNQKTQSECNGSGDSVKDMASVDQWFDDLYQAARRRNR